MADDKKDKKKDSNGEEKKQQKAPEPPRPARLEIDVVGENGQYSFGIQVISDKGIGIKSRVRVLEGDKISSTKETDADGFLDHAATQFSDEERYFHFRVIGSDLDWSIELDGPEQKKEEKKKEKIKTIPGGFWANFKNVIEINKK